MSSRKWLLGIPVILVVMLIVVGFSSLSRVNIQIDDQVIEHWTMVDTVGDVLVELNLDIGPVDLISPLPSTSLKGIKNIKIERAHQITLESGGEIKNVITQAKDVGEFLSKEEIVLNSLDEIEPDKSTLITEDLLIKITRVNEETITLEEEIPFDIEWKNDDNLLRGQTKIITKGKNGLVKKTYLVTYHDGKEVERQLQAENIKEPITELASRGTKQVVQRGSQNINFKETKVLKSSAYTHTGHKTYTGIFPKRGIVAVDPKIIPLGTKLYIEGYGYAEAQDIGSAIKGDRIDLFMETKAEALRWGIRSVRVYILN